MSIGQICADINTLKRKLRPCIKPGQGKLFEEIISQIQAYEGQASWKYEITLKTPLRFKKDGVGKALEVDVFGYVVGNFEYTNILDHCITVRLWSTDRRYSVHEELDSPELISKMKENSFRRVMLRFRFDKGQQKEFSHHIQIGGFHRAPDEYCRFPTNLHIPRFPFFPMNLILVCEFLIANFFPGEWYKLRDDQVWKNLICKAQQCILNYNNSLQLNFDCTILEGKKCNDQKSIFARMSDV